jgi:hypothetical protein
MAIIDETTHIANTALFTGQEMQLHHSNNNNQGHIEDTPENRLGVKTVVCTPVRILDYMRTQQSMPNVKRFVYFFENPSYDPYTDIADLADRSLRHLKIIDSTGNTLDNLILHDIARHRNLKTIELVHCNAIERDAVMDFVYEAHDLFPNFKHIVFNDEKFVYS